MQSDSSSCRSGIRGVNSETRLDHAPAAVDTTLQRHVSVAIERLTTAISQQLQKLSSAMAQLFIIIIIDNRGLNGRWCLTPFLLSLPTAAYLGQRGLTPAGLLHTTAQCHLTILGKTVLFCLNHPSFRTPGFLSFCYRSFCRYGQRGATFSVSLYAVGFLPIQSFCTIFH